MMGWTRPVSDTASAGARMVASTIEQDNGRVQEMEIKTIGIDLAKSVFQLHGVDSEGRPLLRKRLARLMPLK